MSHDYGWRGSCAAGDVTDVVVGSGALLALFSIGEILPPTTRFRHTLQYRIPLFEESPHITREEESLSQPAENSERCDKLETITHHRPAFFLIEVVIVLHRAESAFDHHILKVFWTIKALPLHPQLRGH